MVRVIILKHVCDRLHLMIGQNINDVIGYMQKTLI